MSKERKKRYRLKALPVTVLLSLILMGCIGSVIAISNKVVPPDTLPVGGEPESTVSEETSSAPEVPAPASVRLMAVGDNLIHPAIYQQANRRAEGEGYDFNLAYAGVKSLLSLADITSINQETVMAQGLPLSGYPRFNSPQELGTFLSEDMGFDVVNIANNHCLDMEESGLLSTLDFWDSQTDVRRVGVYRDEMDAKTPRLIEKDGVTFAFLGMTEQLNGLALPKDSSVIIVGTQDEDRIKAMIADAKSKADVVVVNAHWGTEYTTDPNQAGQVDLAEKMVEWGADIIIGHHPHVIQPLKYISRHDGTRGIVAYSLGNFISAQETGWRMLGGALDVTVEKNFETNSTEIVEVRFIPLITQYEGNAANVRIYPLADYTEELAKSHGVRSKTPAFSLEWINECVGEVIDPQFLTPYK